MGNLFFQLKIGVSLLQSKYNTAINPLQKREENLENVELLWTNKNLNKLKLAKPEEQYKKALGMI